MIAGLTPLSYRDVIRWLIVHPDAYLITDIKDNNRIGLAYLADEIFKSGDPGLFNRIIPEIFNPQNLQYSNKLGFEKSFFSLYGNPEPVEKIVELINTHHKAGYIHSVALPLETFNEETGLIKFMEKKEIRFFVHTINDENIKNKILKYEHAGIYTDLLHPTR